jgi:hypothetical protein
MAQPVTSITAAEKVLLYNLPTRNIYGVRRVCTTWNDVIERSLILKPKMFLTQESGKPDEPSYSWSHAITPMKFLYLLRDKRTQAELILNPVLKELAQLAKNHCEAGTEVPTAWIRPEASWSKMYISACTFHQIVLKYYNNDDEHLTATGCVPLRISGQNRDYRRGFRGSGATLGEAFEWSDWRGGKRWLGSLGFSHDPSLNPDRLVSHGMGWEFPGCPVCWHNYVCVRTGWETKKNVVRWTKMY